MKSRVLNIYLYALQISVIFANLWVLVLESKVKSWENTDQQNHLGVNKEYGIPNQKYTYQSLFWFVD